MRSSSKLLLILFLFLEVGALAQQKESERLRARQRELQDKINYTRRLLGDAKNNQRLTVAELGIINQQISYRDELILTYDRQIRELNRQIEENRSVVEALERDLEELTEQYKSMIVAAYKNRNKYNAILFVFNSENINQAYLRVKYMKKVVEYRKRQVELIQQTRAELIRREEQLKERISEKTNLVGEKNQEREAFNSDKRRQQEALAELRSEEEKLKRQLDEQEEKRKELELAIRRAIQKEIAATNTMEATPEVTLASKSFEANKGKLPWPVERGEISGKFGKVPHPVVKGVWINNNGLDITTSKGASVRTMFEGTVTSVLVFPGAGKAVMVSHGNYRTVYSNLQDVFVKKGDQVATKQSIGTLLPSDDGKNSIMHVEVWKISGQQSAPQNPAYWIYR